MIILYLNKKNNMNNNISDFDLVEIKDKLEHDYPENIVKYIRYKSSDKFNFIIWDIINNIRINIYVRDNSEIYPWDTIYFNIPE